MFLLISALLLATFLNGLAVASQESVVTWDTFRVESHSTGEPVVVSGKQNTEGLQELRIEAFGRAFTVSQATLRKLGRMINGMQISSEPGYPELGGRTVYVVFSQGFVAGGTQQSGTLAVNERGDVEVHCAKQPSEAP